MTALPHHLDRTITIGARPVTVFSFFTDEARWASWWGAGSTIEPKPGGRVFIRYPNGVEASGEVLEVHPPERIVFTMGYASNPKLQPGGSRVTIRLDPSPDGTRLSLHHDFADESVRNEHVQGWRYQLSVFSNVVADVAQADAASVVDRWFGAWADTDAASREATLVAIAQPAVRFRDRFSLLDGIADLVPHIGAAQHFMPGMAATRDGHIRHCQGVVLANWAVKSPGGETKAAGTNVFQLDADGRIAAVTGLWN